MVRCSFTSLGAVGLFATMVACASDGSEVLSVAARSVEATGDFQSCDTPECLRRSFEDISPTLDDFACRQVLGDTPYTFIRADETQRIIMGTEGIDCIVGNALDNQIDGLGGSDVIFGRAGNDVLNGGAGDDYLEGEEGSDVLLGGAGDDDLVGDGIASPRQQASEFVLPVLFDYARVGGDDRIEGGAGDDEIYGGPGADTILAGAGNDRVDGGAGADNIFGEDGNDALYSGIHSTFIGAPYPYPNPSLPQNTLDGGAGDDVLWSTEYFLQSRLIGGDGIDVFAGGAVDIASDDRDAATELRIDDTNPFGSQASALFFCWPRAQNIRIAAPNQRDIIGTAGNDCIIGNALDNRIDGGAGDDFVWGFAGNDTLTGAEGRDYLDGGVGNDGIFGGPGDDTLVDVYGSNQLRGDDGFDHAALGGTSNGAVHACLDTPESVVGECS